MKTFMKSLAWIIGGFIAFKYIFENLAWLYHDKDKTLRDAIRLASIFRKKRYGSFIFPSSFIATFGLTLSGKLLILAMSR